MKGKIIYLVVIVLVSSIFRLSAQSLNTYTFTQTVGTYDSLSTGEITLNPNGPLSGYYANEYHVALPFPVSLDTLNSDSLWINLSGFCALKKTNIPNESTGAFPSYPITKMLGFNGVFSVMSISSSVPINNPQNFKLRAATLGTAPNRVFVVEWHNYIGSGKDIQLRLYEADGKIEYKYNTNSPVLNSAALVVGIRIADTTIFNGQTTLRKNRYYGNNTSAQTTAWDSSTEATDIEDYMIWTGFNAYPISGLTYTWTKPTECNAAIVAGVLPDSLEVCAGTKLLLHPQQLTNSQTVLWQVSTDNTTWTDVTNGVGAQTVNYFTDYLRNATPVWYRMKAICPVITQTLYTNATKIISKFEPTDYFEGFEGLSSNTMPDCMQSTWDLIPYSSLSWRPTTGSVSPGAYSGTGLIENFSNNSKWLYTPGIYLESGVQYRFAQMYQMPYASYDSIYMGIGTAPHIDSITNVAQHNMFTNSPSTPDFWMLNQRDRYRRMEFNFTVPATGIYFGGIKRNNDGYKYSDNIEIMKLPNVDVLLDTIVHPTMLSTACFNNQMNVTIKVTNAGLQPISNIPVYLKYNTTTYSPETITQTIAPGSSILYTFNQMVDLSGNDATYTLKAWAVLSGDSYNDNDSSYTYVIKTDVLNAIPYVQNFEQYATPGLLPAYNWYGNNVVNTVSSTSSSSKILRINFSMIPVGLKDSIATAAVGPIQANSFLKFKYRMANSSGNTALMQTADTIYVVASSNCGITSDTLMKINSTMQTSSSNLEPTLPMSLSAFQGQNIRISFITARNANNTNFYFDIDSFQVVNMNGNDVALLQINPIPALACDGIAAPVSVLVKNLGAIPASGFSVKAYEVGQSTPLINYTYSGSINYLDSDSFFIGNILPSGNQMDLKFVVSLSNDNNPNNDTLYKSIQVVQSINALAPLDTSFCGSGNLNLFTPPNTLAFWYNGSQSGSELIHVGNTLTGITSSQDFYVGLRQALHDSAGQSSYNPNWTNIGGYSGYGLLFHTSSDIFLDSVGVFPSGTGTAIFDLIACATCVQTDTLGTYNVSFSNADGFTKYMIPLNQFIPTGNNYLLRLRSYNGLNGFRQDFPFSGFPIINAASPITLESSYNAQGKEYDRYYYFYDWKIKLLSECITPLSTINVEIKPEPVADFNMAINENQVAFNNTSTGGGTFHWDFGNGTTSTNENASTIYDQIGTYTVTLTQTNDCGTSTKIKTVNITTTNINGFNSNWTKLQIYPNPAVDILFLSFETKKMGNISIRIVNAVGKVWKQEDIFVTQGKNQKAISLKGISKGSYWLYLSNDEGFFSYPFVVK